MNRRTENTPAETAGVWLWIVLVGLGSIALRGWFACATPFSALAAAAAFTLRRREAIGLVVFVWAANQAVGFGFLHYPLDGSTLAWGVVIGVAALASLATSLAVQRGRVPSSASHSLPLAALLLSLAAGFVAYELVLLSATAVLPSGAGAFAPPIVAQIFAVNLAALAALMAVHLLARRIDWPGLRIRSMATARWMPIDAASTDLPDRAATMAALLGRRSVSPRLLTEPGPSSRDLHLIAAAGLRAPDHGRLRPWRFIAIDGAPLVLAVAAAITQDHPSVRVIDQQLAAGAAAMNLLNAAHILGYGACG